MREPVHNDEWRTRMEAKMDLVIARVSNVERKASFWGALASVAIAIITKMAGCA